MLEFHLYFCIIKLSIEQNFEQNRFKFVAEWAHFQSSGAEQNWAKKVAELARPQAQAPVCIKTNK